MSARTTISATRAFAAPSFFGRSAFGGVSQEPEYLILSVEFSGENGVPSYDAKSGAGDIRNTPAENWPCEFRVDYVRCYQYNSLLVSE